MGLDQILDHVHVVVQQLFDWDGGKSRGRQQYIQIESPGPGYLGDLHLLGVGVGCIGGHQELGYLVKWLHRRRYSDSLDWIRYDVIEECEAQCEVSAPLRGHQ